ATWSGAPGNLIAQPAIPSVSRISVALCRSRRHGATEFPWGRRCSRFRGSRAPRSPAAGRPAAGVLDVEHDRPPVGTQAGLAGGEVVLHLDEERVAPLH